jgi:cytochrome c-type biogenesis protein
MDSGLLALALVAGAVAAFNPCGFALLPAYLTVLVAGAPTDDEKLRATRAAVLRAIRFATGMTIGFIAVFGLFGLIVTPLALSIERYLPIVTVLVGIVLVLLGIWLLLGHALAVPGLAGRGKGPTSSWTSQMGYGITFALASLSCTIAPFLAVTSTALGAATFASAFVAFIAYGLGMGTVVLVLALAVATSSASITRHLRQAGPAITRLSGLLLIAAGAYVTWYGWFEIRILSGQASDDAVVSAAIGVQAQVTRWVAGLGPGVIAAAGVVIIGGLILAAVMERRRARRSAITVER